MLSGLSHSSRVCTFNPDVSNAITAVVHRVLLVKSPAGFVPPPVPEPRFWQMVSDTFIRSFMRRYNGPRAPCSSTEFVAQYTGMRAARYAAAVKTNKAHYLTRKSCVKQSFIKRQKELIETEVIDGVAREKIPDPRLIQANGYDGCYNAALGPFLSHGVQHGIYHAIDKLLEGPSGTPTVFKELSPLKRGNMLRRKWDMFKKPKAVSIDASRFDQHVTVDALNAEFRVYLNIHGNDPFLMKLLSWQLTVIGRIRQEDGTVYYTRSGMRCSGDMNTSVGNVVLVCMLLYFVAKSDPDYRGAIEIADDGDDAVIISEEHLINKLIETLPGLFLRAGFTLRVDGTASLFERISFCQSSPVFDGEVWVMVRDPYKSCVKDAATIIDITSQSKSWAAAIAQCGIAMTGGIPVLQDYYGCLARYADGAKPMKTTPQMESGFFRLAKMMSRSYKPVTEVARMSFFHAFGIDPAEQMALEDYYRYLNLNEGVVRCGTSAAFNNKVPGEDADKFTVHHPYSVYFGRI